jgi:hypothetical protein
VVSDIQCDTIADILDDKVISVITARNNIPGSAVHFKDDISAILLARPTT